MTVLLRHWPVKQAYACLSHSESDNHSSKWHCQLSNFNFTVYIDIYTQQGRHLLQRGHIL